MYCPTGIVSAMKPTSKQFSRMKKKKTTVQLFNAFAENKEGGNP
jgi:hypothetical protein